MPSFLTSLPRATTFREAPPVVVALAITELYLKLGSFTLEAAACAGLWLLARKTYRFMLQPAAPALN